MRFRGDSRAPFRWVRVGHFVASGTDGHGTSRGSGGFRNAMPFRTAIRLIMESDMESRVGKPAAPFALSDSNGQVRRDTDYRGNWLLMVFHRHLG